MKKLLLSSAILLMASLSILIFQISCSKSVDAQNSNRPLNQIGKIIYVKNNEIWTANYDGTQQNRVPVSLPPNVTFAFAAVPQSTMSISPDGQKVFFSAYSGTGVDKILQLYSVNIDGTGLNLIFDNGPVRGFTPVIAY